MTGKHDHAKAFVRFLIVGGTFSLIFATATAGLIRFAGTAPLPTSVVVYVCCIPLAYFAQRKFAFQAKTEGAAPIVGYAATQIVCLSLVSGVTSRFVTKNFVVDTMLYLAMAAAAAVMSYIVCRFVIFRPTGGADRQ